MATRFQRKGEASEAEQVYERIKTLPVGALLTKREVGAMLGRDIEYSRGPIYRAIKWLEERESRTMVAEEGVGYRVADASQHLASARAQQLRGKRAIDRAWRKARTVNREALTAEERTRHDALMGVMGQQRQVLRWRQKHEERLDAALSVARNQKPARDAAELQDRMARVEEMLARAGMAEARAA